MSFLHLIFILHYLSLQSSACGVRSARKFLLHLQIAACWPSIMDFVRCYPTAMNVAVAGLQRLANVALIRVSIKNVHLPRQFSFESSELRRN